MAYTPKTSKLNSLSFATATATWASKQSLIIDFIGMDYKKKKKRFGNIEYCTPHNVSMYVLEAKKSSFALEGRL